MIKVSILVPVYGVEQVIANCAETLFAQTYDELEYIFVDDCTPDHSIEVLQQVLQKYPERQRQVKILRHEKNRGVGAARLNALLAATGDFIMHVDSDDWLPTDAVERLVNKQQLTDADIVDGGYMEKYADGTERKVTPWHGSKESYLKLLLAQNTLPHQLWARLIRRSLHMDYHILTMEGVNQADDYSVVPRLIWVARRSWIDEVVSYYRIEQMGMFKEGITPRHVGSLLKANQTIADFIVNHDKDKHYAWATKVGLLKIYVQAFRAGVSSNQLSERLPAYSNSGLLSFGRLLLRIPFGDRLVRYLYLLLKGIIREKIYHSKQKEQE